LLSELDVSDQTANAGKALLLAVLLAVSLTGIAGLIASWSTRRGFAVVATIAVLLIGNGIVTAVQGIATEQGALTVGEWAGLFSPYSLYRGLAHAFGDAAKPLAPPAGGAMQAAYLVVLLATALACAAALVWRYRKVAER
jgi:ABC-2 type transport system permease protein